MRSVRDADAAEKAATRIRRDYPTVDPAALFAALSSAMTVTNMLTAFWPGDDNYTDEVERHALALLEHDGHLPVFAFPDRYALREDTWASTRT